MSDWEIFKGSELEWNSLVREFKGDYRQLWQWGEYKSSNNWKIIRYIKNPNLDKKYKEVMQVTYRQLWPLCFIYVPGGVCNENKTGFSHEVEKLFFNKFKYFLTIVRIDSHYPLNKKLTERLLFNNWYVPLYRNNVGLASIIEINQFDGIDKFENASSKWKYNFRRSLKNNLILKAEDEPNDIKFEIQKVSQQMVEYKNVYHILNPSAIIDIANYFEEKLTIITCRNSKEEIIGFRAALCIDNFAWDLFAASNEEGRKLKAGYPLLSVLIEECRKKGAKQYSLAGITPGTARSIFKIEAGGTQHEFIGEYEKTRFIFLGKIFNLLLYMMKFSLIYKFLSFLFRIFKF